MRATPLAVWGHRLSTEQLAAAAREDCRLTHPNQSCRVITPAAAAAVHLEVFQNDAKSIIQEAQTPTFVSLWSGQRLHRKV